MKISFDNRTPAAVVRLSDGSIFAFDGMTPPPTTTPNKPGFQGPTADLFAYLGGVQQRKQGKRGTSGGGTLPDAGLGKCGVLVTSTDHPSRPEHVLLPNDARCVVATDCERITEASTVLVVRESATNGIEIFVGVNQPAVVSQMLNQPDQHRTSSARHRTVSAYGLFGDNGRMALRQLRVTVYGQLRQIGRLTPPRILDLLLWDRLYSHDAIRRPITPWERELGLVMGVDCRLYRNYGGILRDPLVRHDVSRAFRRVCFITDPRSRIHRPTDLYLIRQKKRQWILVSSYPIRGGSDETQYWVSVSPNDAQAMRQSGQLIERLYGRVQPPPAEDV